MCQILKCKCWRQDFDGKPWQQKMLLLCCPPKSCNNVWHWQSVPLMQPADRNRTSSLMAPCQYHGRARLWMKCGGATVNLWVPFIHYFLFARHTQKVGSVTKPTKQWCRHQIRWRYTLREKLICTAGNTLRFRLSCLATQSLSWPSNWTR